MSSASTDQARAERRLAAPAEVERRVRDAVRRGAEVEAEGVQVEVEGAKVTLEGHVRTWADRATVERAAWSAPGVTLVEDHLTLA